jgi:hypothetical protein
VIIDFVFETHYNPFMTVKIESPLLKNLILKNRHLYNTWINVMKRKMSGFHEEKFLSFFAAVALRIFSRNEKNQPEKPEDWLFQLFKKLLDFYSALNPGQSSSVLNWEDTAGDLLAAFYPLISVNPDEGIAPLLNALIQMRRRSQESTLLWVKGMIDCSEKIVTLDDLKRTGFILAWRCGRAEYRFKALEYLKNLDKEKAQIIFKIAGTLTGEEWMNHQEHLRKDPWYHPGSESSGVIFREEGLFTGFGGVFCEPPLISVRDGRFMIQSGKRYFILEADCFGTALLETDEETFRNSQSEPPDTDIFVDPYTFRMNGKQLKVDHPYRFPPDRVLRRENTVIFNSKQSYKIIIAGFPQ